MITPKQWLPLPVLLVLAVGAYMAADLAEQEPLVVWGEPAPEATAVATAGTVPVASATPAGQPAQTAAKPQDKTPPAAAKPTSNPDAAKPQDKAQAAKPQAKPDAAKPSAAPSQAPAAKPTPVAVAAQPKPQATASPAAAAKPNPAAKPTSPAMGVPATRPRHIPASTPEQLVALAKAASGRIDPFVSLEPPAVGAEQVDAGATPPPVPPATPGRVPAPPSTKPAPQPAPGDGMVVTGIITSPKESVAIVAAGGRSRLVQVGDILPGGVRVVSIQPQGKSVIVSQAGRQARLAVKE